MFGIGSDETGEVTRRELKRARTRWVTERIAHARRGDPTRELEEQDRMQPTENRLYTARKETNKVLGRRRFISRQGTLMGDPFSLFSLFGGYREEHDSDMEPERHSEKEGCGPWRCQRAIPTDAWNQALQPRMDHAVRNYLLRRVRPR